MPCWHSVKTGNTLTARRCFNCPTPTCGNACWRTSAGETVFVFKNRLKSNLSNIYLFSPFAPLFYFRHLLFLGSYPHVAFNFLVFLSLILTIF